MSEIIEKYRLLFSYDKVTTTVSSVSPLLSYYVNQVAYNQYAEVYNRVDYILRYGSTSGDRDVFVSKDFTIKITENGAKIIHNTSENTLGFTERVFILPVDDLLLILQSWAEFLRPYKLRYVEVKNGETIIDIITDGFVTALIIEKAVAAHWPDCGGSVGDYYSVSVHDYEKQKELTNGVNNAMMDGSDKKIFNAIETFINLFANGKYSVVIGMINLGNAEIAHDQSMTYSYPVDENDRFTYQTYPSFDQDDFLFSRSISTIDKNRVAQYVNLIAGGLRPKVIAFQGYDYEQSGTPYYIIDGHHKLLAYMQLNINAPCVFISKTQTADQQHKNITPQLISFLKPAELRHVFLKNGNIDDAKIFMRSEMTSYLDKLLETEKDINLSLTRLLYNTYNSTEKNIADWARSRLPILFKNKYQGKGQTLYYKTLDDDKKYTCYRSLPINSRNDFYLWKKIYLEDKEIPAYLTENIKKYQGLTPRNQPPLLPNPPPQTYQGRSFINAPPTERVASYIVAKVLIACIALMALMVKGCL
jgi:hypothetical protein